MRTFTLKELFVTAVFMVLGCLAIHAADDDLITRQITIKLDQAGTLPDKIGDARKYKLTNIKIVGEINGTDLRLIREMAGRDCNGSKTAGKLTTLNLSEAKIVKGGGYYYYNYNYYCTSNDAIGEYAFSGCSGLTSVTIPSSVTSIGQYAFSGCSGLTSVTIPSSVTSIDRCAFSGCSGLTSVTIPSSVTSIGKSAFSGCSGLTSITLPSSVTSIGESAFWGCSGLTSITISSGVTSIGESAFDGCSGLTSVTIPSSVTSIGRCAFSGCSGLTSVTILSSVTSIGESAFWGCSGLTSVTIPSSVTSIDWSAFNDCENLKECNYLLASDLETYLDSSHNFLSEIPVDKIKYYLNGQELTKLEIPSGVNKIGGYSFCRAKNLTSVTIPSSVTSIGEYAFWGCSGLTSVTIPSSVTSIGRSAFNDCENLKECNYLLASDLETYLDSSHNFLSEIPVDKIKYYLNGQELTKLEIPSGVNKIGGYSFCRAKNLTSVTIPSSVIWIGGSAFYGCSGLTSLTIPSSVTSIGASAFANCSGLVSVYVSWKSPLSVDASVFENANTKSCILYVPKGTYDDYWLSNWGVFENIVEYDATGINHVTTSGNAKEISRYAADGQRLDVPTKGLNIVKYSDGSVKKVVVQ